MINDLRNGTRYAMHGMAALLGEDQSLIGHVADISTSGIALAIQGGRLPPEDRERMWLCRVVSPELPQPLEFVAKIVRPRHSRLGYGLACRITEIDSEGRALLTAFEKQRQQAGRLH